MMTQVNRTTWNERDRGTTEIYICLQAQLVGAKILCHWQHWLLHGKSNCLGNVQVYRPSTGYRDGVWQCASGHSALARFEQFILIC